MTPDERWLAAVWPFVRGQLPAAPARVVELGCGPLGGFIPMLAIAGYDAAGVDPQAPAGPWYRRVEFERYDLAGPVDAIVACTSLHHVADLGGVLDRIAAALRPGGRLVIVEWAREQFDEAAARWCSARLPHSEGEPGWLQEMLARWHESGLPWDACCRSWAEAEHLHSGRDILRELDTSFDADSVSYGPYFFPDLAGTTEQDEQAAIGNGEIRAGRIQYSGHRRGNALPDYR